jgi:hypothetical protein
MAAAPGGAKIDGDRQATNPAAVTPRADIVVRDAA